MKAKSEIMLIDTSADGKSSSEPRNEKSLRVQNAIPVNAAKATRVSIAALSITPPPA